MNVKNRRYNDSYPIIVDAMQAWQSFPYPLQRALAEHLQALMKAGTLPLREKGFGAVFTQLRILGDNQKSRRWCDQDRLVQHVYNYLRHVEAPAVLEACTCILKLRAYVRDKPILVEKMTKKSLRDAVAFVFNFPDHV
jgi:hypothetical protein